MSELRIYPDLPASTFAEGTMPEPIAVLTELDAISAAVAPAKVLFERWTADRELHPHAPQDEIIEAYREPINRLMQANGFSTVDVISVTADHPQKEALRQKFLQEHTHADFETRFFVEGQGLFYIRTQGKVFGLLCTRGDLISLPAYLPHWFDLGAEPKLKAIRLFTTAEGWVAEFTGSGVADHYPRLETPHYAEAA